MTDQKAPVLKYLILLLVVVVPLFSLGLSNHGLWSADEPRVAEIGREMALTGNWAVPTLNQRPFLEEPPLYYASLALTFKVFGVSDKVARIPSALFAFGAVLIVFFMANLFFGPRVALLSGLILATSGEYFPGGPLGHRRWRSHVFCYGRSVFLYHGIPFRNQQKKASLLQPVLCRMHPCFLHERVYRYSDTRFKYPCLPDYREKLQRDYQNAALARFPDLFCHDSSLVYCPLASGRHRVPECFLCP